MEPLSSSFISKKSIVASVPAPRRSIAGLFSLLGVVVFILSILFYAGAFGYKKVIENRIVTLNDSLNKQEQAFDPETLLKLAETDGKLQSAKEILRNHTTLGPFFKLLSDTTLKSVRFKSFRFVANPDLRRYEVSMSGEALGYDSIALQSDAFVESRKLKDIVFSDLDLDSSRRVVFNFAASIDPTLLSYEQMVASTQQASEAQNSPNQ